MIDLFPIESCAVCFVEVVSSNLWGAVGHGGDVEQRLAGLGCAGSEASRTLEVVMQVGDSLKYWLQFFLITHVRIIRNNNDPYHVPYQDTLTFTHAHETSTTTIIDDLYQAPIHKHKANNIYNRVCIMNCLDNCLEDFRKGEHNPCLAESFDLSHSPQ